MQFITSLAFLATVLLNSPGDAFASSKEGTQEVSKQYRQTRKGEDYTIVGRHHARRRASYFNTRGKAGKSKKKGKRTPSPTLSALPSSSPSVSHAPSISSLPSPSPSSLPTAHPTTTPTGTPSVSPSISQQPSSQPTVFPTVSPSSLPSASPTKSNVPSSTPSISASPTINVIEGNFIDDLNNSTQSGCPAPPGEEENYAENRVRRIIAEFVYAVRYRTDSADGDQQKQVILAMEKDFHSLLFQSYVNCGEFKSRVRNLNEFDVNKPIGTSSLPVDEPATDLACTDAEENETCLAIYGGVTMLYPQQSDINSDLAVYEVLDFVKNAVTDETLVFSDPNIVGVDYYGKVGKDFTSLEDLVARSNRNNETGDDGIITPFTVLAAVASVIIVGSALYAMKLRRRGTIVEGDIYGTLRGTQRKGIYDYDDIDKTLDDDDIRGSVESMPSPNRLVEIENSRRRGISRASARKKISFPLSLPIIEVGDDAESIESDKVRYYAPIDQCTPSDENRDARQRNSAEFVECDEGENGDWYEGSDIDFSERSQGDYAPLYSLSTGEASTRRYKVPNTVDM